MREIEMVKTASGPKGSFTAPGNYRVADDIAKMFVEAGSARYTDEVKPEAPKPKPKATPKPKPKVEDKPKAKVRAKAPAKFRPGTKVKPTGGE